jgi:hypothetical protein
VMTLIIELIIMVSRDYRASDLEKQRK